MSQISVFSISLRIRLLFAAPASLLIRMHDNERGELYTLVAAIYSKVFLMG